MFLARRPAAEPILISYRFFSNCLTEQPGDPDFVPLATLQSLAEQQHFELLETFGRGKNFTANFKKTAKLS